jgi:hypothetical protein
MRYQNKRRIFLRYQIRGKIRGASIRYQNKRRLKLRRIYKISKIEAPQK